MKMIREAGKLPLWSDSWEQRYESAERILRAMNIALLNALMHKDTYKNDQDIVDTVVSAGLNQWTKENIRNGEQEFTLSSEVVSQAEGIFRMIAQRMWDLRATMAKKDYVDAVVVAIANGEK